MKKNFKKLNLSKSTLSNLEKNDVNGGIAPPRSMANACYVGYVNPMDAIQPWDVAALDIHTNQNLCYDTLVSLCITRC